MAAFGIQLLKHGLALCGKNFGGFVEAWNHVVRRSANVCGDADANPDDGLISVDNTDVDHPIIRLDKTKLPSGSSGVTGSLYPTAFEATPNYSSDDPTKVVSWSISNAFAMSGGVLVFSSVGYQTTFDAAFIAGKYICAVYSGTSGGADVEITSIAAGDLWYQQHDSAAFVAPLYYSPAEGELIDLRTMPQAQFFEFGLS